MDKVLKFLKDNPIFYLATTDGTTPQVRPFGFVMNFEGKLYFCTSNQKNVYKQLKANPKIQIATTAKSGDWLRLTGEAVFNTTTATKQAALDASPFLKNMYSVSDTIFELFYIQNGEATFNDPKGGSRTVKL